MHSERKHQGSRANRHRREKLATCRRLLGGGTPTESPTDQAPPVTASCQQGDATDATIPCPICKTGRMHLIERFERLPRREQGPANPLPTRAPIPLEDSS